MEEPDKIELPPKYYLEYFNYVLEFVKDKYKDILIEKEWSFLRRYYCLSEDAQCLFIRFSNRKGLFFKTTNLKYQEIENIDTSLQELVKSGFVSELSYENHSKYLNTVANLLTKKDLDIFKELKPIKNLKKEEIINQFTEYISSQDFFKVVIESQSIIKLNFEVELDFIKFLFFGNRYMDMTEFVVRDLGFVQYYKHQNDDLVSRFNSRKEAEDKWFVSDQFEIFNELKTNNTVYEIWDWFETLNQQSAELCEVAKQSFDNLILKIGAFFERNKSFELALNTYKLCQKAPSRERQVRNLFKLKLIDEAVILCQEITLNPLNADEAIFSKDFLNQVEGKNKKSKKSTTIFLQDSESITISLLYKNKVELGTIAYYIENGQNAAFSENHLWRSIFGLYFWDIIFDPSLVSFHHPFQRRPSDLHLPQFYEKRKFQISQRLTDYENKESFLGLLWTNYEKNLGIANPFVIWMDEIWDLIRIAVDKIELEQLKKILLLIAQNIVENSRGLPDLFVWSENSYELVEVKSPTDNLSNQQLFWLRYFQEIGVNSKVLRVNFE
jgi:hypothetical protein